MFIAAKLLAFATQPLAWVLLLLTLGLLVLARRRRLGIALLWSAWAILLGVGWNPAPDALVRRLENRYPPLSQLSEAQRYAGVIVLGGALEPSAIWTARGQPALNDAAERMTGALPLLQQHPHLRLLFTGGHGELIGRGLSEADRARLFYASMGVPAERLLFESASRTTYENAVLSATLPSVDRTQPWLLLTSAWHMPRAMASFEKAGWNVTAYPVDFRTSDDTAWTSYAFGRSNLWKLVLQEYLGLLAYRWSGRI